MTSFGVGRGSLRGENPRPQIFGCVREIPRADGRKAALGMTSFWVGRGRRSYFMDLDVEIARANRDEKKFSKLSSAEGSE